MKPLEPTLVANTTSEVPQGDSLSGRLVDYFALPPHSVVSLVVSSSSVDARLFLNASMAEHAGQTARVLVELCSGFRRRENRTGHFGAL